MIQTTKKMIAELDKVMNDTLKMLTVEDVLNMDEHTLNTVRNFMTFYDASKELAIKQAVALEGIQSSLDRLLVASNISPV